jgi:hypothetical protein
MIEQFPPSRGCAEPVAAFGTLYCCKGPALATVSQAEGLSDTDVR